MSHPSNIGGDEIRGHNITLPSLSLSMSPDPESGECGDAVTNLRNRDKIGGTISIGMMISIGCPRSLLTTMLFSSVVG